MAGLSPQLQIYIHKDLPLNTAFSFSKRKNTGRPDPTPSYPLLPQYTHTHTHTKLSSNLQKHHQLSTLKLNFFNAINTFELIDQKSNLQEKSSQPPCQQSNKRFRITQILGTDLFFFFFCKKPSPISPNIIDLIRSMDLQPKPLDLVDQTRPNNIKPMIIKAKKENLKVSTS